MPFAFPACERNIKKSCLSHAFCFLRLWTQHQEVMPKSRLLLSPLVNATSWSHASVMPFAFPACERNIKKSCQSHAFCFPRLWTQHQEVMPKSCLLLSPLVNATSKSHASVMPFAFPACERNIKKSCLSHAFCFPRLWTQHQEVMSHA